MEKRLEGMGVAGHHRTVEKISFSPHPPKKKPNRMRITPEQAYVSSSRPLWC
jgi:hypothetical protein